MVLCGVISFIDIKLQKSNLAPPSVYVARTFRLSPFRWKNFLILIVRDGLLKCIVLGVVSTDESYNFELGLGKYSLLCILACEGVNGPVVVLGKRPRREPGGTLLFSLVAGLLSFAGSSGVCFSGSLSVVVVV